MHRVDFPGRGNVKSMVDESEHQERSVTLSILALGQLFMPRLKIGVLGSTVPGKTTRPPINELIIEKGQNPYHKYEYFAFKVFTFTQGQEGGPRIPPPLSTSS